MSVLAGKNADVYIATGAGSAFTDQACSLVSGTTYQITDTAKRTWSPSTAVTVKVAGSAVLSSTYKLVYGTGKIIFNSAPGGAVTVSGASLSLSQLGQAFNWQFSAGIDLEETQTFGDAWKERTPTLGDGSVTVERFFADGYFHDQLGNLLVLKLYSNQPGDKYFVVVAYMQSTGISAEVGSVIKENVQFVTHGQVDIV